MYKHFCLCLLRTCEKHTEHMDQLDSEMEQHIQRMETRIRQEVCFNTHLGLLVLYSVKACWTIHWLRALSTC